MFLQKSKTRTKGCALRYLGVQVEINARYDGIFIHPALLGIHIVYMGLFSVEIFIRCAAVGPFAYVFGSGWAWHWLDMVAAACLKQLV